MTVTELPKQRIYVEKKTALIYCSTCPATFFVSARQVRAIKNGERTSRCPDCIRHDRVRVKATGAHHRYWTSRYTVDQIVALAEGMWGPRETWPPLEQAPDEPAAA